MNKLIDKCVKFAFNHKYLVLSSVIILIICGWISFKFLSIEAYPDFTNPQTEIITMMPGKGAEEVEKLVTIPLEKELNGIPGETNIRSYSIFGLSDIIVTFQDDVTLSTVRQQVIERLNQADIPDGVKPVLGPETTPIGEIYRYTLSSDYYNPMTLKSIENWDLEKSFRQIPGIIDVNSFGGPIKTYNIDVNLDKLQSYHLGISDVFNAISKSNSTTGGNYINKNGQAFIVRGLGLLKNTDDIKNVVISVPNSGVPIRVKDVANVAITPSVRLGQVGKDHDDDAIEAVILMRRGENPGNVINDLYKKLPEIKSSLPKGIKLDTLYDRMDLVNNTLDTISHNVIHGILLVIFILFLFTLEYRITLIASIVIPLSLLFSFIMFKLFNMPANLLSLGAIDFGIIVDGAVIMVENIYRHLAHDRHNIDQKGKKEIILKAVKEVSNVIIFSTIIIMCCFLPVLAFDGVAGKLFRPLALTMNFTLIGAVLVSIFLIPVLCRMFLTKKPLIERKNYVLDSINKIYMSIYKFSFKRPQILLTITTVLFFFSLFLFTKVGSEFLPILDEGNIWLRVTVLPSSTSVEHSVQVARQVREKLLKYSEVKTVVSQIGSSDDGTDGNLPSNIEFFVDLKPAKDWRPLWHGNKEELVNNMSKDLEKNIPGILMNFSQYIQDMVDEAVSGAKGEIAVKLYGPDLNTLQKLGDKITSVISKVSGIVDVADNTIMGQPQYKVQVDIERANRYGISSDDIKNTVETAIGGKNATELIEGEKRFNVFVRLDKKYRDDFQKLENIVVNTPNNGPVPLSELANITVDNGAMSIPRSENSRFNMVKFNIRSRDLGSAVADAQKAVKKYVKIPPEYQAVWGGQFEDQQKANARLMIILPVTIIAIGLILFLIFRKKRYVLIGLSPIPVTIMGGIFALFLTHTYFSVSAGVGFIAAIGVSIQNGAIILYSMVNYRKIGYSIVRTALKIPILKVRPVLAAAMVAISGLIPMAISNGIGAQSQKPFAIVIIGGLLVGTLFSIFLVPILFKIIENRGPSVEI